MEEYSKPISKFNSGVLQIQRLHNIWSMVRSSRESGNYRRTKDLLDSAWIELAYDASNFDENDETKFKSQIEQFDNDYEKYVKERNRNEIYKLLVNKEILLRTIQERAGKGSRYVDPDDDEID